MGPATCLIEHGLSAKCGAQALPAASPLSCCGHLAFTSFSLHHSVTTAQHRAVSTSPVLAALRQHCAATNKHTSPAQLPSAQLNKHRASVCCASQPTPRQPPGRGLSGTLQPAHWRYAALCTEQKRHLRQPPARDMRGPMSHRSQPQHHATQQGSAPVPPAASNNTAAGSQVDDAAGDLIPLRQARLRVAILVLALHVGAVHLGAAHRNVLGQRHQHRRRGRRRLACLCCHGCCCCFCRYPDVDVLPPAAGGCWRCCSLPALERRRRQAVPCWQVHPKLRPLSPWPQ